MGMIVLFSLTVRERALEELNKPSLGSCPHLAQWIAVNRPVEQLVPIDRMQATPDYLSLMQFEQ